MQESGAVRQFQHSGSFGIAVPQVAHPSPRTLPVAARLGATVAMRQCTSIPTVGLWSKSAPWHLRRSESCCGRLAGTRLCDRARSPSPDRKRDQPLPRTWRDGSPTCLCGYRPTGRLPCSSRKLAAYRTGEDADFGPKMAPLPNLKHSQPSDSSRACILIPPSTGEVDWIFSFDSRDQLLPEACLGTPGPRILAVDSVILATF